MRRRLSFWEGSVSVLVETKEPQRIVSELHRRNFPIWDLAPRENGLSFSVLLRREKALMALLKEMDCVRNIERKRHGFPAFLERIGARWGFFIGAALFGFALFFSRGYVWSVDVVGNAQKTALELRERLAQVGLKAGTRIRDLDCAEAEILFRIQNPDLSYASIRLVGTRAVVEVREREEIEKEEADPLCANLIARKSGEIVRCEIASGQLQVRVGEYVGKGMLLASGLVEHKNGSYEATCAKGKIYAKTENVFEARIELERESEVLTGRETSKKRYELLGFGVTMPFHDPEYKGYELLQRQESVTLFGRELPVLCTEWIYAETERKIERLTVDRAKVLAYDKYERYKRDSFATDTVFLEENVSFSQEEGAVRIRVELCAEENIAQTVPFRFLTDS